MWRGPIKPNTRTKEKPIPIKCYSDTRASSKDVIQLLAIAVPHLFTLSLGCASKKKLFNIINYLAAVENGTYFISAVPQYCKLAGVLGGMYS